MHIERIELNNFKRFTHLIVENIPLTAKLVVLVGPNGSGKTSFLEAINHYYKYSGYGDIGDYHYLYKAGKEAELQHQEWYSKTLQTVDIGFYDASFPKNIGSNNDIKGHFYFRSAYRNEPDFQIDLLQRQSDPTQEVRLSTLIQNDQTVSANYQRLVANTISGVYDSKNDSKTVEALREELVGKIQAAMSRVFDDLVLSSIGDPLRDGNFYFTKGNIEDFHYRNLSAGEKSAFDLILDMVIQSNYYPDAVYCIDEPETHMHTKLQGKVLRELYNLTPKSSQLWVSTHSIGMLQEAENIENESPGSVTFLDFDGRNFDEEQLISPSHIGKAVMNKFYELAFGDFAKLMLPKEIIFCEGNPNGTSRKDYDKTIFTQLFGDTHPDSFFISGGSCSELENIENRLGEIMSTLLKNTKVIKIVDRDDRSEQEVRELFQRGIRTTSRRHLEAYLLDDEIIRKLCDKVGLPDKFNECKMLKENAIESAISRGRASDDIKAASGEIYTTIKRTLSLSRCGNNADSFMRDTMAPLVTPDTETYRELEQDIFGNSERE
ncbi:ATP-binding protein [Eubacterium sp. 1001713B170207_170306_E7]|uniref:AAA family ATPase n=1 Tax=Eubacterium sp. 1001713B170207_170306_E7 TaxID=2787097 RepID=UPI0018995FA9|nr:ATP-binding protein [Eubacterium sp. 1001713B170207_170306_E7]